MTPPTTAVKPRPGALPSPSTGTDDRPLIWIDGAIYPRSQAKISVYDHGLLYGDGVFEGIRVYGGKIFKCRQHIERLFKCAERIRLAVPYTRDEVSRLMHDTVKANGLSDAYIRLVVTRGVGSLGLNPFKCPRATVICIADTINLYPAEFYSDGLPIIVAKRPRIPVECLDPRIKSLNYLNNILAKIEAIDAGCLEAIMLNTKGFVAECTGDNIFVVRKGRVSTPPTDTGILEGVTRRFVLELCKKHSIPAEERNFKADEVMTADEVFLTGTAAEIIAVRSVDTQTIGDGREGPVTRRLREAFKAVIAAGAPED